ncbi:hypothetical protein [Paludibacterium purpuratum]|uniref:Uncharacterized protein n=1 Tax=Paludibacterium purpuratum TaxID=1144873 RepID=A0A4R7B1A9_9NEIS|nr:hypothetical protein [Paludibacterium purpuratum]TDR76481.1 hypothetical protein DFP86_11164 [Paludibacterium purpuratum]
MHYAMLLSDIQQQQPSLPDHYDCVPSTTATRPTLLSRLVAWAHARRQARRH